MAIDAQGKDYLPSRHLNMTKYKLLWTTLSAIRTAQKCVLTLSMDTDHMRILRVSRYTRTHCHMIHTYIHTYIPQVAINQSNMNDNALEELSWAREPRQKGPHKESVTRIDNLPKFSEWAAGRHSCLDTDTINKHVKQMVEVSQYAQPTVSLLYHDTNVKAVFRMYDTDNSGSISTEEFDAISSNFPFIECFSVLDQDK